MSMYHLSKETNKGLISLKEEVFIEILTTTYAVGLFITQISIFKAYKLFLQADIIKNIMLCIFKHKKTNSKGVCYKMEKQ